MAGNSKGVVIAALIANGAIAILKFLGYLLTLSPAMLSETYHSISDTGNQVFLLIGIRYGAQEADQRHPFGYGKAQFFYSFLVSVLLFGIAGWESAKHGYDALMHGTHEVARQPTIPFTDITLSFPPVYVNYAVLIGAILFESYAFVKARREIKRQMDEHGWKKYREAFRKTSDVTTLTALTEDTIALSGAGIALFGIYLSRATGNGVYDAASALLIGIMLMVFAVALAWENKRLLLGESMPADEEAELRTLLAGWDGVDEVVDFRTVYFGPGDVMVATEVAFADSLTADVRPDVIEDIEAAIREAEPHANRIYVEPVD